MSRWKDLLKSRAAAVLEQTERPPAPPPVQTPVPPPAPPSAQADPAAETCAWLQALAAPPGPVVVARHRVVDDPALWRQAMLAELQRLSAAPPRWIWPAAWDRRRRILLADIAPIRAVLERRVS